jgi:hypothetical protein
LPHNKSRRKEAGSSKRKPSPHASDKEAHNQKDGIRSCVEYSPQPSPSQRKAQTGLAPSPPAWSFAKQNSQAQCSALGRLIDFCKNRVNPPRPKGDFFVGLPIDIGFDSVKPGRGGGRFFFRITPEFHKKGVAVPIGFIWQIYNWKIYSKK